MTPISPQPALSHRNSRSRTRSSALTLTTVTVLFATVGLASNAFADSAANLNSALLQARAGTSCGSLHLNPVVQQAAERFNKLTDDWLNHAGTQVPPENPLPGLKILGYGGNTAASLQGAGKTEANAIKGAMLEGYKKIPTCSYTDYGVSMVRNTRTGYYLSAVVMAGA